MQACARILVALVLSLASFVVHADDLQFVNGGGPYTAPVGSDFVAQDAVLVLSGYPNPANVYTVQLEILGGCGTFAGATKVSVSLRYSSGWWMSALPAVHLSQAGFCTLRLTYGSLSRDARLDAWDPATLHPEPVYPIVAVPLGSDLPEDVAVRVVDAGGRHAGNETVRFQYTDCLRGVDRDTGTDGVASALNASGPSRLGHCAYPAILSRNGSKATIDIVSFDPSKALIEVPGSLQAYVGESFTVPVRFQDENGEALPRVPLQLFAAGLSTGANAVFAQQPQKGTSENGGTASVPSRANAQPGYYDVLVVALGRELRVPIVQQRRGEGAPPLPKRPSRSLQDLWWGGATQNGWGMSVVQHRDVLFSVIYMYDGGGMLHWIPPDWLVMPGGRWNSTGTTFYGPIYRPTGPAYYDYDAGKFSAGTSWGTLSITYVDDDTVEIYERDGGTVRQRRLTRQPFGTGAAGLQVGDMWWGGSTQNGWGLTVLQQGASLFCVWFTYDANGPRTWFVMPPGSWTSPDTWQGRIYRTSGSDGWGWDWYAPADFRAQDVGSFKLQFSGDTATFTYDMGTHSGVLPLQRQPF